VEPNGEPNNQPNQPTQQPAEGDERLLIDRIVEVEGFKPEAPVARIDAPLLSPFQRTLLTLAVNAVRAGTHHFSVAVTYDKQFDEYPPRIANKDYIEVEGISGNGKMHVGVMVAAPTGTKHGLYIRMADLLRADGENINYTSMNPRGIRTFQILSMFLGPAMPKNGSRAARPPGT